MLIKYSAEETGKPEETCGVCTQKEREYRNEGKGFDSVG
jgi:hypothetical protein